jgi:hypothetical protein
MGAITNQDKIAKHYRNPALYPLTDKEKEQLERWIKVDQLIRAGRPSQTIVGILMNKEFGFGVSRATAYNDIADTKMFFGTFYRIDKDYWRDVIKDWTVDEIFKAKRMNDSKAVAMHTRNLIDMMGLNKDASAEFDPEMYQGNTYQLTISIGDQNFTMDMDNIGKLPTAQLESLVQALQSPKLSAAEYLKILDEPDTEDGAAEEIITE